MEICVKHQEGTLLLVAQDEMEEKANEDKFFCETGVLDN